jgi:hypothetical protein
MAFEAEGAVCPREFKNSAVICSILKPRLPEAHQPEKQSAAVISFYSRQSVIIFRYSTGKEKAAGPGSVSARLNLPPSLAHAGSISTQPILTGLALQLQNPKGSYHERL